MKSFFIVLTLVSCENKPIRIDAREVTTLSTADNGGCWVGYSHGRFANTVMETCDQVAKMIEEAKRVD